MTTAYDVLKCMKIDLAQSDEEILKKLEAASRDRLGHYDGTYEYSFVGGTHVEMDHGRAITKRDLIREARAQAALVNAQNAGALAAVERRIEIHIRSAYENLLEIGHCLIEAKTLVPHGGWTDWVAQHTGFSEQQAQRLMRVAREVPAGSAMEKLPITKIQTILMLPADAREEMAERAVAEDMSLRALYAEVEKERKKNEQLTEIQNRAVAMAKEIKEENERVKKMLADVRQDKIDREKWYEQNTREWERKYRNEIDGYKKQLEEMQTAETISPAAQREIDRLKRELADAEAYAEQQAELRQQAQQSALNASMGTREARREAEDPVGDLCSAVRDFIGSNGILPYMGSRLSDADSRRLRAHLDMLLDWVHDVIERANTYELGGSVVEIDGYRENRT